MSADARAAAVAALHVGATAGSARFRPYPMIALGGIAAGNALLGSAIGVLGPDISRTLGIGVETIAALSVLYLLTVSVASLVFAAAARAGVSRAGLALAAAAVWTFAGAATAVATNAWGLAAAGVVGAAAAASIAALHRPLLADLYPPTARVRALAGHGSLATLGAVAGPAVVAILTESADFTWRGAVLATAAAGGALVIVAAALREPGTGCNERECLDAVFGAGASEPMTGTDSAETTLDVARRLLAVPTLRRIVVGYAVVGALAVPIGAYLPFFLEDRWALDASGRGWLLAAAGVVSVAAALAWGPDGDRILGRGPAALLDACWKLLVVSCVALVTVAFVPWFGVMAALFCFMSAGFTLAQTAMAGVLLTLLAPSHRPHAAALTGIALAGPGGIGGVLLVQGLDEEIGYAGVLALLALPGLIAAAIVTRARSGAEHDYEAMREGLVDRELTTRGWHDGVSPPLLEVRRVDALFDGIPAVSGVDLELGAGEVVTLLGTNGAGKTTLLRVIAGLQPPTAGEVYLDGREITWTRPEHRFALGIRHVAGGRAVFDPLTVEESLRLAGRAAGLTGADARAATAAALAAFPALEDRLTTPAGALSAGERQMLGLAQALLERPRLLLIDELSAGLAPAVLATVLEAVGRLAGEGAGVLLADQSLDVALTVGGRAVFLERGEVRHDGPVQELAERKDLLRPIFLPTAAP